MRPIPESEFRRRLREVTQEFVDYLKHPEHLHELDESTFPSVKTRPNAKSSVRFNGDEHE